MPIESFSTEHFFVFSWGEITRYDNWEELFKKFVNAQEEDEHVASVLEPLMNQEAAPTGTGLSMGISSGECSADRRQTAAVGSVHRIHDDVQAAMNASAWHAGREIQEDKREVPRLSYTKYQVYPPGTLRSHKG